MLVSGRVHFPNSFLVSMLDFGTSLMTRSKHPQIFVAGLPSKTVNCVWVPSTQFHQSLMLAPVPNTSFKEEVIFSGNGNGVGHH